ncbi:MAG: helix-turn-helix domain-containing protein [Bradyrhizobium sp.]|nr:helix-turn-helix domain-containing protein [Bradyrhizobium sp.]
MSEWLAPKQTAEMCGISRRYLWIHRGTPNAPPHHRRGARYLYRRSEVEAWIEAQRDQ